LGLGFRVPLGLAIVGAGAGTVVALAEDAGANAEAVAGGVSRSPDKITIGIVGEARSAAEIAQALPSVELGIAHIGGFVVGPVGLGGGAPAQQVQPGGIGVEFGSSVQEVFLHGEAEDAAQLPFAGLLHAGHQAHGFSGGFLVAEEGVSDLSGGRVAQIHGDEGSGGGEGAVAFEGELGGVHEGDGEVGLGLVGSLGFEGDEFQGRGGDEGEGDGRFLGEIAVDQVEGEGEGLSDPGGSFQGEAEAAVAGAAEGGGG
jgi:hypothetical protein